jgi:urease accessory protein
VVVENVLERSVVTGARGHGPLRLLTPRNHGAGAWVYVSSLGGGYVGADDLALDVDVRAGATAFLSSQSAGKVYRAADSRFTLNARVAAGGTLVNWPDPLMAFAGARLTQRQHFELAATGSLVCVDALTAGRVASGERWAAEHVSLHLSVTREDRSILVDAMTLSAKHGALEARLAGVGAMATIVIAGPRFEAHGVELHAQLGSAPLERLPSTLISSSRWPWGLIIRIAAPTTAALSATLSALLAPMLISVLGEDPWARKR